MHFLLSLLGIIIVTEAVVEFVVSPSSIVNKLLFLRVPKAVRNTPGVVMTTPLTRLCGWCLSFWVAQISTFYGFYREGFLFCFILGWVVWRLSNFAHDIFGFIYRKKKFTGSMVLTGRGA